MEQHQLKQIFSHGGAIDPTVLTILGATGDLSLNYLLPALLALDDQKLLPNKFNLVCLGRRALTTQTFIEFVAKNARIKLEQKQLKKFSRLVTYIRSDLDDLESFSRLKEHLKQYIKDDNKLSCRNLLFYFATAPQFFPDIAKILKYQGLLQACKVHNRKSSILVEKPFGHDLKSAKKLNKELLKYFSEEQIYRIDHYLGKETVQNLLVTRFANDFLEPIWNREYVEEVVIDAFESNGVGSRIQFYDQTGALNDLVQNHLLQILALLAMDAPKDLDPKSIRDNKVKVLKALKSFNKKSLAGNVARGQYLEYATELGKNSETETFVAVRAKIQTPRWKGVPFILRTGKRLSKKNTQIQIKFKKLSKLFGEGRAPNSLIFRIQPDESVQLLINNKLPGSGITLHEGSLDFGYKTAFLTEMPSAYERLLLDFLQGDQRLFIRSDEIEAAWKFTDSIINSWDKTIAPIKKYKSGIDGRTIVFK